MLPTTRKRIAAMPQSAVLSAGLPGTTTAFNLRA
jgi:hypothetical protein